MRLNIFKFLMLFLVTFSLFTLYRYFNEDMSVLQNARNEAGVSLIDAAQGSTRYQEYGDSANPTVILIHSFNGFIESWQPNIKALVDAEYHVVVYDLLGRGLSDRPRVKYDLTLFRKQLQTVLNTVKKQKVHLIGSSFGAVIATDFTLHYPEKVGELIMVGPAGWPDKNGRNFLLDVPVIGELVFHYFGTSILLPKVKEYFQNAELHSEMIEKWQYFASFPGFMRSALSMLRHSPVLDFSEGWKSLGKLNKPVLFIWGKQDVSFPFSNTKKIPNLIPLAKILGIEKAAHWVNVEQPMQVNKAIISFLAQ